MGKMSYWIPVPPNAGTQLIIIKSHSTLFLRYAFACFVYMWEGNCTWKNEYWNLRTPPMRRFHPLYKIANDLMSSVRFVYAYYIIRGIINVLNVNTTMWEDKKVSD